MTKAEDPEDRSFIDIDRDELDREWIEQPGLRLDYGEKHAEAKAEAAEAKADLELVYAELDEEFRLEAVREDEKLTEAELKQKIIRAERYQNAKRRHIRKEYHEDMHKAVIDALEHRKKALEDVVFLWGQEYFSTPRAKGKVSREVMDEVEKKHVRSKGSRERRRKET